MKTAEAKKEIKEKIRAILKGGNFDKLENTEFYNLKEVLKTLEEKEKENNISLFIQAQNLVNKQLNKLQPEYIKLIAPILGEKFINMDNSRNHKFKNIFDHLEGLKISKTKKVRLTVQTLRSYNNFILDISVHIWNEDGQSADYSDRKYLALFENQTSFKSFYDQEKFKTFNAKKELKKLNNYEAQKKKLEGIKAELNAPFMKQFLYSFERDNF